MKVSLPLLSWISLSSIPILVSVNSIYYTASYLRHLHFPTVCAVCVNADEKKAHVWRKKEMNC